MTKEELKDEMKNRISLALKDPILQQGFEIICKENAELKNKLEHRNCVDCSNHSSNLRMRNLELEKENAELKEENTKLKALIEIKLKDGTSLLNAMIMKNLADQLTKAKELLNMFLRLHYNPIVDEHTLFCKVEQFLNSEVEK